jgi:hypothetical protein
MKTLPFFGKQWVCGLLLLCLSIGLLPHAEAIPPNEIEKKARDALSHHFRRSQVAAENTDRAYAIFFMNEDALDYFYDSRGFEIGSSPSLVIADGVFSHSASSSNQRPGILTFAFNQTGLMLDIGVHIAKITKFEPGDRWQTGVDKKKGGIF